MENMQDSLSMYLKEIGTFQMLSAEEELELAKRYREGEEGCLKTLVNSNLRLVVYVAKKYTKENDLSDLISAGNIGLIEGIKAFDPEKGCRLSTICTIYIRKEILKAIGNSAIIRLPDNMLAESKKLKKETEKITEVLGREPYVRELVEKLEMPEHRISELLLCNGHVDSLDRPLEKEEQEDCYYDIIEDTSMRNPEGIYLAELESEILSEWMAELSVEECELLELHFGLGPYDIHSMEELASMSGKSAEECRITVRNAVAKLRYKAFAE